MRYLTYNDIFCRKKHLGDLLYQPTGTGRSQWVKSPKNQSEGVRFY